MAFKTFAPGVLTSSDVNTFLMRQAVITCTSSTRPASPSEGMTIYETDTNVMLVYSGTAWETVVVSGLWVNYTPTFTNFTLGNGTLNARYHRAGRLTTVICEVQLGSTSSVTGDIHISLPFTSRSRTYENVPLGTAAIYDDSTTQLYLASVELIQNTVARMRVLNITAGLNYLRQDPVSSTIPMTWDNLDSFSTIFHYQAQAA